jgi:hypothetical protein
MQMSASSQGNVLKAFKRPSDIVVAENLSAAEKIKLLQDWETDLREILVAAEEGMTRESPDDPGVQLSNIRAALDQLGAPPPTASAPTKAGGN